MDTTKGLFTQRYEVRNSIRRIKYLELAFYSLFMHAERRIVQLNALPGKPYIPFRMRCLIRNYSSLTGIYIRNRIKMEQDSH